MAKQTTQLNLSHGYETDAEHRHAHLRLWLRLLTCTSLLENEIRKRLKAAFGETLPQFDLMAQLERHPGNLTMGELSQRLMVTSGNVTGLVDRLIRRGMVQRIPSPTDRRILYVTLTHKGRTLFRTMASRHERWVKELLGNLDNADVERLMELLATTRESVGDVIKAASDRGARSRTVRKLPRKSRKVAVGSKR
jgi:DNA-binding MarR family transcriptional regulator